MFIDTHIDTLWAMGLQNRIFSVESEKGHVDLPRAQKADLLCGFFTGFPTESNYITEKMLREWILLTRDKNNKIRKIENYNQLEQLESDRKISKTTTDREIGAVLHFEGATGIDSGLNRLYIYYEAGLRSMSLTWNEMNQFAAGQIQDPNRGLTTEGFDLLSAMEDLGIIIDVSHLNDKSFWDVINHTSKPIIATHSNVREIADHKRNLTREMVNAMNDTGGTIGINFSKSFLKTNPKEATKESAIKMFQEIINLTSINCVHIGTDLDGATFPDEIKDITYFPNFLDDLKNELNLSKNEMIKIEKENIKRIMKKVWK